MHNIHLLLMTKSHSSKDGKLNSCCWGTGFVILNSIFYFLIRIFFSFNCFRIFSKVFCNESKLIVVLGWYFLFLGEADEDDIYLFSGEIDADLNYLLMGDFWEDYYRFMDGEYYEEYRPSWMLASRSFIY